MMRNKFTRKTKKWLKATLLTGAVTAFVAFVLVVVMILANYVQEEETNSIPNNLTESVVSYQPLIERHLKEMGKEAYTAVIMALMMQESGGRGNDPMQASESYCGEIGCISDPEVSIDKGIDYFVNVLEKTDGDVKLALQSYNFGEGFIDYVKENGGSYTQVLAIAFSKLKYEELKDTGDYSCIRTEAEAYDACYGDIYYVDAVMSYYPSALAKTSETVQVAQIGLETN
ncbi:MULTISPECIES: lysozyme family protein [Paraliobacillus]|uniref:lysozyme family protein n=1 Tax=Paraliobacillus TaxID=200903 RepID=UPI000DD2F62A|nr:MULTISPECIES: lysozyme family protein [Paraliobacillus]